MCKRFGVNNIKMAKIISEAKIFEKVSESDLQNYCQNASNVCSTVNCLRMICNYPAKIFEKCFVHFSTSIKFLSKLFVNEMQPICLVMLFEVIWEMRNGSASRDYSNL